MTEYHKAPKGCAFLLRKVGAETLHTPERFTEEQRMFARSTREFMDREVRPHADRLETGDHELMVQLMHKAAELGLLMIDVPAKYDGLQVDKTTSMLVAEHVSTYGSFATTYLAHVGIGTLPVLYFGSEETKAEWLPKLASGEAIAAYALTEPGSGSDALAAKAKAVLTDDGEHYILNGTKMWITNAGFADVFTVFCQVDGDKFTGFLVEADRPGVSLGAEEHKMGLKGSSTRLLILEDVKVPVGNVLGEVGKGAKIAFNVLNVGRFKLGVGALGGGKHALHLSAKYANERLAFGQPISSFGAIQTKLGEMVARLYALESMSYRIAGYMDESLETIDPDSPTYSGETMAAVEEFVVEDSIMKVYGSEIADFVVDEAVQIHGGMGYSREVEVERMYRDSRIQRIFEGTNEINRLLIPGMILKRIMKGQLNLFEAIQRIDDELAGAPLSAPAPGTIDYDVFLSEQAKKVTIYALNHAFQKHMMDIQDRQEILLYLADMLMDVYAMDSTVGRTLQLVADGGEAAELALKATHTFTADAARRVTSWAEALLAHIATGDELSAHFKALDHLAPRPRVDTITLRRDLAAVVIDREKYPF